MFVGEVAIRILPHYIPWKLHMFGVIRCPMLPRRQEKKTGDTQEGLQGANQGLKCVSWTISDSSIRIDYI